MKCRYMKTCVIFKSIRHCPYEIIRGAVCREYLTRRLKGLIRANRREHNLLEIFGAGDEQLELIRGRELGYTRLLREIGEE